MSRYWTYVKKWMGTEKINAKDMDSEQIGSCLRQWGVGNGERIKKYKLPARKSGCNVQQVLVVHLISCVQLFGIPWASSLMSSSPVLHYLSVCANSCVLNWWCYLTISSSAPPSPFALLTIVNNILHVWKGLGK